ncbi:NUDIX domain-containing protein [Streptomyces sp. Amel2xC10]|uniref:NUDIX domain-containing protein n=1 Tax=Streptomyces sp. Amel2xC10 TaxID=1305826 RepID=UPI000A0873FB|nr:NUDIX hydrolase [Streptomyces sp. Amel2xC10]SMF78869.1 ADP-ribose pyrophosphatase YjhB, NUDIX family [Streptomyces sp. Amel2xC10]
MAVGQCAGSVVQAVVVYDGQVLLVAQTDRWELPSGVPEPGETAAATAARAVYELTGYLVDGSQTLSSPDGATPAVVCRLLTELPSGDGRLAPQQIRWAPLAKAVASDADVPAAVRDYLRGHMPA